MPKLTRQQKITFAEMRAAGVRGLLIYCSDYKCSHWTAISGDRWTDDVRLSDLEPRFICKACVSGASFMAYPSNGLVGVNDRQIKLKNIDHPDADLLARDGVRPSMFF